MVKITKAIYVDAIEEQIDHAMEVLEVEKSAWKVKFYKRNPQKLTATSLIKGFWMMQKEGMNSLRNWALFSGKELSRTVSKQAVDNRLNEEMLAMLELILTTALSLKLNKTWLDKKKRDLRSILTHFNRIIIQDSTIQQVHPNNYSEEYYELLGYEIYLTNIEVERFNVQQIAKLYGLRWYIEVLFKAWKSYYNFRPMFEENKMDFQRTKISMYLVLLQFVYLTNYIYQYIKEVVEKHQGKLLSYQKFIDVCKCLLEDILAIQNLSQLHHIIPQFIVHAVYEKRKKRKNMKQKIPIF